MQYVYMYADGYTDQQVGPDDVHFVPKLTSCSCSYDEHGWTFNCKP